MKRKIALNFLPLEEQNFSFTIYRKLKKSNEKKPKEATKSYRLPVKDNNEENWTFYWISFNEVDGYEKFICEASLNPYLTELFLFLKLKEIAKEKIQTQIAKITEKYYTKRIFFSIKEQKIGKQVVWIEPYFLRSENELGFIIDFDFIKSDEHLFDKEVQKFSLSLDNYYRANKNYHSDKFDFIKLFIHNILPKVNKLETNIIISNKLKVLQVNFLETKIYRTKNEETSPSQFMGIKNNGPYGGLKTKPCFYFIFKPEHTDYARDLVKALEGKKYHTFEGLNKMFEIDFDVSKNSSNIKRLSINDYSKEEINKIAQQLKNDSSNKIAIFIFPEEKEEFYFSIKNQLLQFGIVTQGVHVETLKYENKFKWSISSIGLQIFAKLGGIPWRMKPSNDNCLIVGIGQAHDKVQDSEGKTHIKKYFSYSVLVDSSGEYISMNKLSENENEDNYLKELSEKIENTLLQYQEKYDKITIHIPYKIKDEEIEIIKNAAIKIKDNIEVVVLKIGDKSKFFGYNSEHNSLIPYESSFIQLSSRDYLVWTEGINFHNKKVIKHYANPLHVDIYYVNKKKEDIDTKIYLQDILNLTGANWRGFNAKAIPISMFYPRIISKFIKFFDQYNLDDIEFENLPPWFL